MVMTPRDAADETLARFYRSRESREPRESRRTAPDTHRDLFRPEPGRESEGVAATDETPVERANLIGLIIRANPSATEDYLNAFSDRSLSRYLAHLDTLGAPRGLRWERPGDSPAIMVRVTAL